MNIMNVWEIEIIDSKGEVLFKPVLQDDTYWDPGVIWFHPVTFGVEVKDSRTLAEAWIYRCGKRLMRIPGVEGVKLKGLSTLTIDQIRVVLWEDEA